MRAVAERLVEAIEQPVVAGGRRFNVRTSVGVVLADDDASESAQALLSHADIALYEAKARDKGGIVLIEGDSRLDAAKQVQLKEQVAQPVLDQFHVVYQPIVDLQPARCAVSRRCCAGSTPTSARSRPTCSSRWPSTVARSRPSAGSCSRSRRQLAAWQLEAPLQRVAVGVNVSVRQLDEPGFAAGSPSWSRRTAWAPTRW